MSQRSLLTPSPGPGSRSPTPFYYGKVYRIANQYEIGEFVDGNLWKYRKKGSGSISPSFDDFDEMSLGHLGADGVDMVASGTQMSPGFTKATAVIFDLDSPPKQSVILLGKAADSNNNHHAKSNGVAKPVGNGTVPHGHAHMGNGTAIGYTGQDRHENGYVPIPGSPTYASASFMANVHRFHCKVCRTPEKCAQNPTMKMACPIKQCPDPECGVQVHTCMLEEHHEKDKVGANSGGAKSGGGGDVDATDGNSGSGTGTEAARTPSATVAALAAWRAAHYRAYAAKYGSRLPSDVLTVSRDADPASEGGKRAYGGAFYSNRFRASQEIYLCEIGFHGPADVPNAKYTVYVEIFEPQAPEAPKALTKSKSKSKYKLQLPVPAIPVHVYPKGVLKERICRRRWTDVEARQGEIFYVDLLEDDVVRGQPPVQIHPGVWYLIQFCIEGSTATRNCNKTLEQVKVTLVGSKGSKSRPETGDGDSIQFSFNVGSMQMPELRFAVPVAQQPRQQLSRSNPDANQPGTSSSSSSRPGSSAAARSS